MSYLLLFVAITVLTSPIWGYGILALQAGGKDQGIGAVSLGLGIPVFFTAGALFIDPILRLIGGV